MPVDAQAMAKHLEDLQAVHSQHDAAVGHLSVAQDTIVEQAAALQDQQNNEIGLERKIKEQAEVWHSQGCSACSAWQCCWLLLSLQCCEYFVWCGLPSQTAKSGFDQKPCLSASTFWLRD